MIASVIAPLPIASSKPLATVKAPAVKPLNTLTAPPAIEVAEEKDEEDFTLLMGMDEDSSGDEEVLEEG